MKTASELADDNLPAILSALRAADAVEGAKVAFTDLLVAVKYGGIADLNSNPANPGYTPRIPAAFVTDAESALTHLEGLK